MGSKGIAPETHPAGAKTEKFIRMLRNGSGSTTMHHAKVGKAKGMAKEKERRVETVIAIPNLCATIGVRETATAAMLQLAISPTMALKAELKEKEMGQRHYLLKP